MRIFSLSADELHLHNVLRHTHQRSCLQINNINFQAGSDGFWQISGNNVLILHQQSWWQQLSYERDQQYWFEPWWFQSSEVCWWLMKSVVRSFVWLLHLLWWRLRVLRHCCLIEIISGMWFVPLLYIKVKVEVKCTKASVPPFTHMQIHLWNNYITVWT